MKIKKHLLTRKDYRDVERNDGNKVDHIHPVRDKPGDGERSQDLGERSLVPFYFPNKFSLPLLWADNESSNVLQREESNGKTVNNR